MVRSALLLLVIATSLCARAGAQRLGASFPHDSLTLPHHNFLPAQTPVPTPHKSPFLAWFLSWVVPGAGQGYNGQWGKAAAFFVPAVAAGAIAISNRCATEFHKPCVSAFVLWGATDVGSQIDAANSASAINRR